MAGLIVPAATFYPVAVIVKFFGVKRVTLREH